MTGVLITFEGIDRSGKHTQIDLLRKWLEEHDVDVTVGREPGGTAYGEAARRLVQDPSFIKHLNDGYDAVPRTPKLELDHDLNPAGELFGYLIARAMFIEHRVKPVLDNEGIFIADRLGDSSVAYQGYGNADGNQETIDFIKSCNNHCYKDIAITRTYLLDITAEECRSRKGDQEFDTEKDRIEQRETAYFDKVRKGYLTLAQQEPERFVVIDGMDTRESVHIQIVRDVQKLLNLQ